MVALVTGNLGDAINAGAGPQDDERIVVFTWNLNENVEAFKLACKHLAGVGSFVAALQEVPADENLQLTGVLKEHDLKLLSSGQPKFVGEDLKRIIWPTVALISSNDIEIESLGKHHQYNPELDSDRRLEGLTLRSKRWQNLQILGVHAWDRWSRQAPTKRHDWARIMRDVLDEFWDGGPLVVMGDLNAHPWSAEVTAQSGLYAIRRKDWPSKGETKLSGREKYVKPLYNPMWQLVPDGADGKAQGTIFYPDACDLHWHCFDQIIVSEHLQQQIGSPEILTAVGGEDLLNTSGKLKTLRIDGKDKPEFSDHLPVQLLVNLGRVQPCKISMTC